MRMNRRKVLTALGGITIGGGALFGTGAFTQVQAERTVTVNTDGDGSALIGLAKGTTASSAVKKTGDTLEINFDNVGSGSGLNLDAITKVGKIDTSTSPNTVSTSAFKITNNSDISVGITFSISLNSNQSLSGSGNDYLNLQTDTSSSANSDIGGGNFGDLTTNTLTLASGATALVVIEVDLRNEDTSTGVITSEPLFSSPATITADRITS